MPCGNLDSHVYSKHHEVIFCIHIRRHYSGVALVYDYLYIFHPPSQQDSNRFYEDVLKRFPLIGVEILPGGIAHIPDIPCR